MVEPASAVVFDVDAATVHSLRQAFPELQIEAKDGADSTSLAHDWHPSATGLLVVGACGGPGELLGVCRELRGQLGRAHTPLLVLLPHDVQASVVRSLLEVGADSCLILPVHAKELVTAVARAQAGNRPGRHTLGLDRAQWPDQWRDEGGEG